MELENANRTDSKKKDSDKAIGVVNINADNLSDYLGVQRHRYGRAETENQIGQVTGLAWTQVGGELLTIESTVVPGKGKLSSHWALPVIFTRSWTFICMFLKALHRKTVQVQA